MRVRLEQLGLVNSEVLDLPFSRFLNQLWEIP